MRLPSLLIRLTSLAACSGAIFSLPETCLPFHASLSLAQTPLPTQAPAQQEPTKPQQTSPTQDSDANLTVFQSITYRPPQTKIAGRTAGAGRRTCSPPIPLAPESHIGLTTSTHPTFFWYQPSAQPVTFLLVDAETDEPIYETTIQAPQPGIMQTKVPESVAALAVGKSYLWLIDLACSRHSSPANDSVAQSWIQRIEPTATLAQALVTASPGERPALYAAAGIWYDTLTHLAGLRRAYPNDARLTQAWTKLLQAVDLSQVATATFAAPLLSPGNQPGTAPTGIRAPEVRPPALPSPITPRPQPVPSPSSSAPAGVRSPELKPPGTPTFHF